MFSTFSFKYHYVDEYTVTQINNLLQDVLLFYEKNSSHNHDDYSSNVQTTVQSKKI